ncbi:hypothetical protein MNB_SV-15-153 [hydrothermal vent metagenome]|uniref:Roadblock/LAMTOR2 domain-containing protein n=1 Tax=hydrothermal vent metagenome TaxID=652676 RepID=A0A1W1ELD4_9ZZZZ
MIDESILENIGNVKGYIASGITTASGELIVSDTHKLKTDFSEVAATFNDIFADSHTVAGAMGLGIAKLMELQTESAVVLMSCSGEDSRIHLHGFAIFAKDGNITLAKMALKKIMPLAVDGLA